MKLKCYGCGEKPEWSLNKRDYCDACYLDRGYCNCDDCATMEDPCLCDCEENVSAAICAGCHERKADRMEDDFNRGGPWL